MSGSKINQAELDKGVAFSNELEQLIEDFMLRNKCDEAVWKDLLERMIEFEESLTMPEMRMWLYAYIARAALNARKYELAVSYAKAAIILNSIHDDVEGVNAAKQVLADLSCWLDDFNSALQYYEMIKPNALKNKDEMALRLVKLAEGYPSGRSPILDSTELPRSIDFKNAMNFREDEALEMVAAHMRISKQSAKRYLKTANKMSKEDILKAENV